MKINTEKRIDLAESKIDHDGESATLRFPNLSAWLAADPDADPAPWGAHTVADVEAALGYARAVVALAYVRLDPTNPDHPQPADPNGEAVCVNLDDVTVSLEGPASATCRALAAAAAYAVQALASKVDDVQAARSADDILARRQKQERRVRSIQDRIAAITCGRADVHRDVMHWLPEHWWNHLDETEATLTWFEAQIEAALVERAAEAQAASFGMVHRRVIPPNAEVSNDADAAFPGAVMDA